MKQNKEFRYRLIYEALSLFSNKLSKCESFESVADCLLKNIKYILDYNLLRLSFYHDAFMLSYTLTNRQCIYKAVKNYKAWKQELQFTNVATPVIIETPGLFKDDLRENNIQLKEYPEHIIGWNFKLNTDSGLLVTFATSNNSAFSKSDVPVLKLVVENLASKLLSLKLIDELAEKKLELEEANKNLQNTNEIISKIVSRQDEVIEKRTAEVNEKNKRLLQISKHNAHTVREPLSRIMGILMMVEQESSADVFKECLPMLLKSTTDLNKAINVTVKYVDEQILKMKDYEAQNNVG